jgi:hypothetical protein
MIVSLPFVPSETGLFWRHQDTAQARIGGKSSARCRKTGQNSLFSSNGYLWSDIFWLQMVS